MGHGSNIRALMTLATFIPESDEFDMHTPCIEAYKVCQGVQEIMRGLWTLFATEALFSHSFGQGR
jgi:hypothetical protein